MKKSKRIISFALILIFLFSSTIISFASQDIYIPQINDTLIDRLQTTDINSIQDFENVLLEFINDRVNISILENNTKKAQLFGLKNEIEINDKFSVIYDTEKELITLIEMNETRESQVNDHDFQIQPMSTYTLFATAEASTYSWIGMKLFTVKTEAQFQYNHLTVSTIFSRGYFTPAILSLWNSSPTTHHYPTNPSSLATAETYGLATLNLALAAYLGININFDSMTYILQLNCNQYGSTTRNYYEYE